MVTPIKHDWPKIIAEIEAAGITVYKISLMVHRRHGTVMNWKRGGQPRHYEGEMLLMIHREYVPHETMTINCPSDREISEI